MLASAVRTRQGGAVTAGLAPLLGRAAEAGADLTARGRRGGDGVLAARLASPPPASSIAG